MAKSKTSFFKKIIISLIAILLLSGASIVYYGYRMIYKPNVVIIGKSTTYIYIKTGSTFEDVMHTLYERNFIKNKTSFEWVAERKKYKNKVKPGRYLIKAKMNNNDLIDLLRSGEQEPVKVVFNTARTKEDIVSKVCRVIEADSLSLIDLLNDNEYLKKYGFEEQNILALLIPNTYEFYWNTSAEQFVDRMAKEYKSFWNDDRKNKAKANGLSQTEVAIIASIVQQESNAKSEKPVIAGVYINRLKKGMKLQADPTVIYAVGDFNIHRVLNEHLCCDSPYNTYMYVGLPPGPICLPTTSSIDAVLNYEHHNYIYFCAKEDFSGKHNFAKTLNEHNNNAQKFRAALNRRGIKK